MEVPSWLLALTTMQSFPTALLDHAIGVVRSCLEGHLQEDDLRQVLDTILASVVLDTAQPLSKSRSTAASATSAESKDDVSTSDTDSGKPTTMRSKSSPAVPRRNIDSAAEEQRPADSEPR